MPKVLSSVKAILINNNKLLLIKEKLTTGFVWDLPGGKIEYGESPQQTIQREIKEELNLNIEVNKLLGVWFFYNQETKDQIICHTFLCKPVGEIKIDTTKNPAQEEFIELRWAEPIEIINKNSEFNLPEDLLEIIKNLEVKK